MPSAPLDVTVVGAGIIGASIAWRLAQRGARVMLLDRRGVGEEASWAGAGMLAPGGEVDERTSWTAFALESLGQYRQFVEELQEEGGHPIDFRLCGAVEIAISRPELDSLVARAQAQNALGIRSMLLDQQQVRDCAPMLRGDVAGAVYFPDDAVVDPRDVMRCLKQACVARGVQIREGCAVEAIHFNAGSVETCTAAGRIASGFAVLAAGAWSSQVAVFCGASRIPIVESFPIRGHLLGYMLKPGSLTPILRHGSTYLVQRCGGLVIAGTSSERVGFERTADPGLIAGIAARAGALLPHLESLSPQQAWVGFRPATPDFQPVIQRVSQSPLWLAYGHYRNGILMAPATAQRVSSEISASWGKG